MSKRWCIALSAVLVLCVPSLAADKDPLLDHMTGRWVLTGTIEGQQTTHDVEAQWILQNTYVRLTEVSREKDKAGKPARQAQLNLFYLAPPGWQPAQDGWGEREESGFWREEGYGRVWVNTLSTGGGDPLSVDLQSTGTYRLYAQAVDADGHSNPEGWLQSGVRLLHRSDPRARR